MLVQTLVAGVLGLSVATGLSQTMVASMKGQVRAVIRDDSRRAFTLVERHLNDQKYPDVVNGCNVDNYGDYQPDQYGREVTISCSKGKTTITQTQLVPCEACAKEQAEMEAASEEPVDPAQQQMEEFFS